MWKKTMLREQKATMETWCSKHKIWKTKERNALKT